MNIITWSWIFLFLYIALMLAIGVLGSRRVRNADDFATARGGYGPVFLAFAFAATTAAGRLSSEVPALPTNWVSPVSGAASFIRSESILEF